MSSDLFLGIDGGGSKCHAVAWRAGEGVVGSAVTGPASTTRDFDAALESVVAAAHAALADAGLAGTDLSTLDAGIGLAGLNLPGEPERIAAWRHPFARAHFATDVEIACLGAHAGGDGAVIIAGTGSSACVRLKGQVEFFGGSGFPAGDFGSGAALGLRAVQAVLLAADGLAPPTAMTSLLATHFGASGVAIAARVAGAPPGDYAALAPHVFEAAHGGDNVAENIVRQEAAYLSLLARRLLEHSPPRLSMIGGIAQTIAGWLDEDVRAGLSPPLETPAVGAALLAHANP